MMAKRITMTKKKNVMSKAILKYSLASPTGDSNSSPIPPPDLIPM